jgi:predicted nucleic acid-binding protein
MLLDTNAISAWAEQEAGFLKALRKDWAWYLPSIALGEYRFGLVKSNRRTALEEWLAGIQAACTVLNADAVTAKHYAEIRASLQGANRSIPYHDIWIAALAIQHTLPVMSRDAHFDRISGIRRISWEEGQE